MPYPNFLVTSVIRGSEQGESHGGVYLVNGDTGTADHKLDWNTCEIDFEGRGADRGLRGIAYYGDDILIAASDEVFIFDQDFTIKGSITSPYLKHCHEICIWDEKLYLTSTGFDSILVYDLPAQKFVTAFYIDSRQNTFKPLQYSPDSGAGPAPSNRLHINSVSCKKAGLFFSGRKASFLFRLQGGKLSGVAKIPTGTHNAQLHSGGLVYNDTLSDQLVYVKGAKTLCFDVPAYNRADIINIDKYESQIARAGFGRGLCCASEDLIVGGSSPSSIAFHSLKTGETIQTINLSMDVRNAVHGLEVWPY